jgi:hypothetical protein
MKLLLREIGTVIVAITAVILGIIFIPIGFLYTLFKPLYDHKGKKFLVMEGVWFLKVLYQLWGSIKKGFYFVGYIIDLIGNALVGELIEDIVTAEEDTLFGKGDITISAALGDLKKRRKLNGRGIWLANVLSFLDPKHKDHCIAAIELYEFKKKQI